MGFDLDFEDYNEWDVEGVNPLAEAEVEAQVRHKEGEEAWRALMAKVWEAVCFNEKSVVKKLVSLFFLFLFSLSRQGRIEEEPFPGRSRS